MKLILELLLILGLIIVTFLIFIALCTYLSCLFKKLKEKHNEKKEITKKQKTQNKCLSSIIKFYKKCLSSIIKFYKKCQDFVLLHRQIMSTILFIFITLGIPIAVQNNQMNIGIEFKKYIKIGTPRDWFGFWSSYIGTVASMLFAYFNTKLQLNLQKYEKDAKELNEIKDKNEKYSYEIFDYRGKLDKIKQSPESEQINKIEEFKQNYNTEYQDYMDTYNKKLSEISSLNYEKVEKVIEEYAINSLKFTESLNKLLASPDDSNWDAAIEQTDQLFFDFSELDKKINILWSEFRAKS